MTSFSALLIPSVGCLRKISLEMVRGGKKIGLPILFVRNRQCKEVS
jgi:hypothetical protein